MDKKEKTLLEEWRNFAYSYDINTKNGQMFWMNYFNMEKGVYEQLLANPDEVVKGTVEELAAKYDMELKYFVGFLDGINDSLKEANYYNDLKLRLKCNDIKGFCLQPTFILAPGLKYKADFIVFNNDGTYDVIDVKGFKTKEYIAKKKVFEDKYNLKLIEIE